MAGTMFFEFLEAVVTLDVFWVARVIASNPFWLFLISMICFYFWGPSLKKVAVSFVILTIVMWTWVDFEMLSGWGLFVAGFLAIYYISKIAVMTLAEDMPSLKKHMVFVSEMHFISVFVLYNLWTVFA